MDLIFDACCLGRHKTGNETYTRGLLRGFAELASPEVRLTVLTTDQHQGVRQDQFEWVNIPLGNFVTRNFWTIPHLLQSRKPDLFHAAYWARYWKIRPYVVVIHDMSFISHPAGFKSYEKLAYANLIRGTARNARHIVTVSEFSRQEIHEHAGVPLERITVTYNGLDACFRPPAEPTSSDQNPPYILYVGNLHPRKNLIRLLEAFVQIKSSHPSEIRLKIVGQKAWACEPIFETLRKHRIENDVDFTGYISQEDVVRLYQNATVTAFPSLYEGFGLPILEAMACGSPVVASNTTSLPEVAGDAGILVNPESSTDIAAGLWRVLSSSTLQADLRQKGYLQAKRFTWLNTAQTTLAAYRAGLAA